MRVRERVGPIRIEFRITAGTPRRRSCPTRGGGPGCSGCQALFLVPIGTSEARWARETIASLPSPRLILNLGVLVDKRWPPRHFAEVGRRATMEFGAGLIVVGADEDRPLAQAPGRHLGSVPVLNLSGQTTLLELAAWLRRRPVSLQRHRASSSGRRRGSKSGWHIYMYKSGLDRSLRTQSHHGSKLRLVRTKLPEAVPPA